MINYRSVLFCSLCLLTMVGCDKKEKTDNPYEADFNQKIQSLAGQDKIVPLRSWTTFPWTDVCLLKEYNDDLSYDIMKKFPLNEADQIYLNQGGSYAFYFIDEHTKTTHFIKINNRLKNPFVVYEPTVHQRSDFPLKYHQSDWGKLCYTNTEQTSILVFQEKATGRQPLNFITLIR